jgi:hypothetical protein
MKKKIDFVENILAATKKYQKVPKSTKKYEKSTKKVPNRHFGSNPNSGVESIS